MYVFDYVLFNWHSDELKDTNVIYVQKRPLFEMQF